MVAHVYGLMITGKAGRDRFAMASAFNFAAQVGDGARTLVIVNHGETSVFPAASVSKSYLNAYPYHGRDTVDVLWVAGTHVYSGGGSVDFVEARVSKRGPFATLGDLRNLALSRVPLGDIFVTWDDDDYRGVSFLAVMERHRRRYSSQTVMLLRRVECSLTSGPLLAWVSTIRGGAINTLYAVRASGDWQTYASLDVFEDEPLKQAQHAHSSVSLVEDVPAWIYVRFHHGSNTSPFATSRPMRGWRSLHADEQPIVQQSRDAYLGLVRT